MLHGLSFVLLLQVICSITYSAYNIATFNESIINPSFPNHEIPILVYYPFNETGHLWPTLIFAHGFECQSTSYTWIYKDIVPLGYIVVYVNSFTGYHLNETEFAIDQRYTLKWLNSIANNNKSSPLYQQIDTTKAMSCGHSEGGGASIESSGSQIINNLFDNKYKFNSIFVMAPCGKQNAVAPNAQYIDIPIFVFTGTMDCACPGEVAIRLFDLVPETDCKFLSDVTNGTHCHWMNAPIEIETVCSESEKEACKVLHPNNDITISEKRQLEIASKYMQLFINATIVDNNNQNDFNKINQTLNNDKNNGVMTRIQVSTGC